MLILALTVFYSPDLVTSLLKKLIRDIENQPKSLPDGRRSLESNISITETDLPSVVRIVDQANGEVILGDERIKLVSKSTGVYKNDKSSIPKISTSL
jgi:hypothetical protein